MNFQGTAARFAQAESGSNAFCILSRDAFNFVETDPINTGRYFVIDVTAKSCVCCYEDQSVMAEFSDSARAVLVEYNRKQIEGLSTDAAAGQGCNGPRVECDRLLT